jgi:allophanate hydrolase
MDNASRVWALGPSAVRDHLRETLARIERYDDPAVWIHRATAGELEAQLEHSVARRKDGTAQPLMGLVLAIKDNIDVAGMPTTAACPDFAYRPETSATVVERLVNAGALIAGKTNLDQFATGLVGTRSPYGACRNVYDTRYIAGGSSSGSAVAVAAGLVDAALGTDTAGSGRVPAAFNNIIGLKPTAGLLSTHGVVPACRSLDCVSVFVRTIDLAERVMQVAGGFDEEDPYSRPVQEVRAVEGQEFRFGVPAAEHLEFFGNSEARRLYEASIERAREIGGTAVVIDFAPFRETARLLYDGPWVAERLAAIRPLLERDPEALLPVTRQIISSGAKYTAVDVFEAQHKLESLRRASEREWAKMDVLLLPTTGTIYTIEQVEREPVQLNQNLGYYTNFVNLLGLCALAVPAGFQSDGLPMGVTFMARGGADAWLCDVGRRFLGTMKGAAA